MQTLTSDLSTLRNRLSARARAEGFDDCRVTRASLPTEVGGRLQAFLDGGLHGDMGWMADTFERRRSPDALWPEARSAVMVSLSYAPDFDPLARLRQASTGVISVYALNRDYHDVVKGKLKRLAQWFARETGAAVKVFTDTAPLMEKPLAAQAGVGWQGKHTNLVSRQHGSWLFLGALLTDLALPPDREEADHCGSCTACLAICPTQAFPHPRLLDARRCISYLTIEHKGHIDPQFRKAMGNRIYGCDDCLAVCPWNKFAAQAREQKFAARNELTSPRLLDLLKLDDGAFRRLFSGSPVKRIGRDRFIRNCLIAAGNSADVSLVPAILPLVRDEAAVVRAMAVWALRQLAPEHLAGPVHDETDAGVLAEWQQ